MNTKRKQKIKAIIIFVLFLFVLSFTFLYKLKLTQAGFFTDSVTDVSDLGDDADALQELENNGMTLSVTDKGQIMATQKSTVKSSLEAAYTWAKTDLYEKTLKEGAARAFWSAASQALNTVAYDTATWLGSGGNGRKPLFVTESWDTYLNNVADNAAGKFIEELGQNGPVKFNLCQPSFGVNIKIGLGLANVHRPKPPECSFSQLRDNWNTAIYEKDFLVNFQDMFNPSSNDVGIALMLHTGFLDSVEKQKTFSEKKLIGDGGWLDIRDMAGNQKGIPTKDEVNRRLQQQTLGESLMTWGNYTGTFMDATNIFLNQLAITAVNNLMGRIGKAPISSPYSGNYGGWLADYSASPRRASSQDLKDQFRKLVEPNFTERGDYEILGELSSCQNPTAAGSTNCVIEEKFRQAISKRMTVGQAIDEGYLNPNGIFGFKDEDKEPDYLNQNYPYRSMIILRKYRIIPVGWEVGSQYLNWQYQSNFTEAKPGICTLGDMIACYSTDAKHKLLYDKYKSSGCTIGAWCIDLVDPDWVLKSPKNYCKKEGFGTEFTAIENTNNGYAVSRKDNYCADNQSCIKEANDGSCEKYGYCTEERGSWNFGGKTCEPLFNTCQTYRARDGQTVSYLENTLQFCTENGVGCKEYCSSYDYENKNWLCGGGTGNTIYLNDKAKECDAKEEGCHEFVRTKAGLGVNLLKNASFEEMDGTSLKYWGDSGLTVLDSDSYDGKQSIKIAAEFNKDIQVGPSSYTTAGHIYNFSFWAKNCSGTFSVGEDSANPENMKQSSLLSVDAWQRYEAYYIFPNTSTGNKVNINVTANNCLIDAIKLEAVDEASRTASAYSQYKSGGEVYERLLPDYLTDLCYEELTAGYKTLKTDAPAECGDYARTCTAQEEGCELYTSQTNTSLSIPAKVKADDYCPSGCVGYNTYIQGKTYFEPLKEKYLIPKTAKTCNAGAAGCSEFTNLDKIEQGGESKEYYSYLRRCQKPNNDCSEYYTWEGSDETGFQLKVFSLKTGANAPYVYDTEFNNQICDSATYNPNTNPTCRQFYDKEGNVSYAFYQYTVSCSDDCHPFRLNNFDVPYDVSDPNNLVEERKTDCASTAGTWDDPTSSCIYMAIPGEGATCAISAVGCRKYAGNAGSNLMIVNRIYDFESAGMQGWAGGAYTNESSVKDGHSLGVNGGAISVEVGQKVKQGKSYELSFVAKNSSAASIDLTAEISDGSNSSAFIGSVYMKNDGQWNYYTLSLPMLEHTPTAGEILKISGGNYYIDNIILTEKVVNYYFIKNSWATPEYCDEDLEGNPSPGEMLGCDKYKDRGNKIHYLKKFSSACPESAVGCELVIDTHNLSSSYDKMTWNTVGSKDYVEVPADSYAYVVYDKDKACGKNSKGCQLLGQSFKYDNQQVYNSVYRLNNPDDYNKILCGINDEGCESWSTSEGNSYFKDPGNMACEWRNSTSSIANWYKVKVNRCDTLDNDGQIKINSDKTGPDPDENKLCLVDSDCGQAGNFNSVSCTNDFECIAGSTGYSLCINKKCGCKTDADCGVNKKCANSQCVNSCVVDNNDYLCQVEATIGETKTFGMGGVGNNIKQPSKLWAGLCPANQSGCTEYIDPESRASANLVKNSDFSQKVNSDFVDWKGGEQKISLEQYTLYSLSTSKNFNVNFTVDNGVWKLNENNQLVSISGGSGNTVFFTGNQDYVITLKANPAAGNNVSLRKTMIGYQLKKDVDKSSCSGVYRFGEGCIIFNERSIIGTNAYNKLVYDVFATDDGMSPQAGSLNNANTQPIKVEADRVCNKWLACKTLVKDSKGKDVCYDVGLCDSFSGSNECNNWVVLNNQTNQTKDSVDIKNLSGYSKAAYNNINVDSVYKIPNNLFNTSAMKQESNSINLANGGFEYAGTNRYPIGWIFDGGAGVTRVKTGSSYVWMPNTDSESANPGQLVTKNDYKTGWDETIFKVINNPTEAAAEGICWKKKKEDTCGLFNPEGSNFLSLNAQFNATTEKISVTPGMEFVLSGYVNTKKLTSGMAVVSVVKGDAVIKDDLTYPLASDYIEKHEIGAGQDWKLFVKKITVPAGVTKIKIHLYGATSGANTNIGKIFFDDLKIEPVLKVKTQADYVIPRTCRLYPKDDSLTCTYYDDKGVKNIGMNGYCLEYDRYPGDPNTCLLWYPIDKLKGEGIEEGAGYSGKFPVYYCGEVDMDFSIVEPRRKALVNYQVKRINVWSHWYTLLIPFYGPAIFLADLGYQSANLTNFDSANPGNFGLLTHIDGSASGEYIGDGQVGVVNDTEKGIYKNCFGSGCGICPFGYVYNFRKSSSFFKTKIYEYCVPIAGDYITTTFEDGQQVDWYEYNGDLQRVGGDNYVNCYNENTDEDTEKCSGDYKNYEEYILNAKNPGDSRVGEISDETGELTGIKNPVRVFFHKTREFIPISQAINENKMMSCNKIYNTVTNIGDNKAWYARIDTKSDYSIDVKKNSNLLNADLDKMVDIDYNSDYLPYGSIKNNIYPINNPFDWDGNVNTPKKDPITVGAGQTGGTSFSCAGKNCRRMGICSGNGNNCLVYSIVGTLGIKSSVIGRSGNEKNFNPYAIINLPEQYSCPSGQVCIPIESSSNEKDNLKRLFAENYGAWQWQETQNKCEGGPFHGYSCTKDQDCESPKCLTYCVNSHNGYPTTVPGVEEYVYGTPCTPTENEIVNPDTTVLTPIDMDHDGEVETKTYEAGGEYVNPDCLGAREGVCENKKCVGGYFSGAECAVDMDCQDCGGTTGNKCVGYLPGTLAVPTYQDCDSDDACVSGVCNGGHCTCASNNECASNKCEGGFCRKACTSSEAGCNISAGKCTGFDCIEGLVCNSDASCNPLSHNGDPATESKECNGLKECRDIPDEWQLKCENYKNQEDGYGIQPPQMVDYCYVDCLVSKELVENMKVCPSGYACIGNSTYDGNKADDLGFCAYGGAANGKLIQIPCTKFCAGVDFYGSNRYTILGGHKEKCTTNSKNKEKIDWCQTPGKCVGLITTNNGYKTLDPYDPENANDYWEAPKDICANVATTMDQKRTDPTDLTSNADFCGKPPVIVPGQIKSDKSALSKQGFINLTFHTNVDMYQLPLVEYSVDWGDGDTTIVSGVEMMDRPYNPAKPEENNPHSLYHSYSYWNLLSKDTAHNLRCGLPVGQSCCSADLCKVTPRVKIKDNWGWCNNGVNGNPCPYGAFPNDGFVNGPTITVRER